MKSRVAVSRFEELQIPRADPELRDVLVNDLDLPPSVFVLLDAEVGRHRLDRRGGEAAPGVRIQFPHLLDGRLDHVERIARAALDVREAVLDDVVEVRRNERDEDVAEGESRGELQQQALPQIAGPDTRRVELL